MRDKTLQIVRADGWHVIYSEDDIYFSRPLALWALIEDEDGDRRVTGLDGSRDMWLTIADETMNFICFCHESDLKNAIFDLGLEKRNSDEKPAE